MWVEQLFVGVGDEVVVVEVGEVDVFYVEIMYVVDYVDDLVLFVVFLVEFVYQFVDFVDWQFYVVV